MPASIYKNLDPATLNSHLHKNPPTAYGTHGQIFTAFDEQHLFKVRLAGGCDLDNECKMMNRYYHSDSAFLIRSEPSQVIVM